MPGAMPGPDPAALSRNRPGLVRPAGEAGADSNSDDSYLYRGAIKKIVLECKLTDGLASQ
jgi:hypothetical protein